MNIHEYQAKAILREFGVPVPDGHVCYNSAGAREWAAMSSIMLQLVTGKKGRTVKCGMALVSYHGAINRCVNIMTQ